MSPACSLLYVYSYELINMLLLMATDDLSDVGAATPRDLVHMRDLLHLRVSDEEAALLMTQTIEK